MHTTRTCNKTPDVVVLGAGLAGCIAALELGRLGRRVILLDRMPRPMLGASRHNEGKLHLGYVYAADPKGKTHKVMASGSLRFLDIVERLTGVSRQLQIFSDPFTYIIPEDSALTVEDLAAHVQRVDETTAGLSQAFGLPPLAPSIEVQGPLLRQHYSGRVKTAFFTPEIAVDPGRVADIVSAAIYAHPLIEFRGSNTVLSAEPLGAEGYKVAVQTSDGSIGIFARGVINALWEDRMRIDAMIGLPMPSGWSQRWKATIVIDVPPRQVTLPSTTAFVGPYGDFVLYGDRRIYLSWYPACRLSMSSTATPEDVRKLVAATDQAALKLKVFEGLATLMPKIAELERFETTTRVGGGFIMAQGTQDIDQSESGLHERHQIGVAQSESWVSVSTGKFCTAPVFGVEAAQTLAERVG